MKFEHLSAEAKRVARQAWIDDQGGGYPYYDWWVFDDFVECGKRLGIHIETRQAGRQKCPAIWFSGFWSQGDGASYDALYSCEPKAVELITEHAPNETLLDFAQRLTALQAQRVLANREPVKCTIRQKGTYSHSGTMQIDYTLSDEDGLDAETEQEFTEIFRSFADWMYRDLEAQYNSYFEDSYIDEQIHEEGISFARDGSII